MRFFRAFGFLAAAFLIGAGFVLPAVLFADGVGVTVTIITPQCNDSSDNDGDLLVDYPADPGCSSASDNNESDVAPECNDNLDNEGDGRVDFPLDLGCDSDTDDSEDSEGRVGGGGPPTPLAGDVLFAGDAFPDASIKVLRGGLFVGEVKTGDDGRFSITVDDIGIGTYTFTLVATDANNVNAAPLSYTLRVLEGVTVMVANIIFPPTVILDKIGVIAGESVTASGSAPPENPIRVEVRGQTVGLDGKTESDSRGQYAFVIDTRDLPLGLYGVVSRIPGVHDSVVFEIFPQFVVGRETILPEKPFCPPKADLNGDCRVDLIDFSIAAYWWEKVFTPEFREAEVLYLNGDGVLDLRDFSIMAYYWTG